MPSLPTNFLIAGFAACLALAAPANAPANAEEIDRFQVENWIGGAYSDDSGGFSHCTISAEYRDGSTLMFSIAKTRTWAMGVYDTKLKVETGKAYPVTFAVDNFGKRRVDAQAIAPHQVLLALAEDDALFDEFRKGYRLTMVTGKRTWRFQLQGTADALTRLKECADGYATGGLG